MPDGRLLHLRDTYPIETAWAPQYVGAELRQVRAAAREARLAGLRASAEAAGQGRDLAATQAGNPAFPLRTRTRRRPRRRLGSRRLTAAGMTASPASANETRLRAPTDRSTLRASSEARFQLNDEGMAGRFSRTSKPSLNRTTHVPLYPFSPFPSF